MEFARRNNKGKLRYSLIPSNFKRELAKVYTMGAEKYTLYNNDGSIKDDGAQNWRKGRTYLDTLDSVYRHLEAYEMGEDNDMEWPEDLLSKYGPTSHLANAAFGLAMLIELKDRKDLDNRIITKKE